VQTLSLLYSTRKNADKLVTDPESGEIICSNCGQVILHTILEHNTPESPAFNTEEYNNKSRTYIQKSLVMQA
jgi:transcription initiation factor TFIIB